MKYSLSDFSSKIMRPKNIWSKEIGVMHMWVMKYLDINTETSLVYVQQFLTGQMFLGQESS